MSAPGWREELDAWSDVIDVLAQVLRYVVSEGCQINEEEVR